MGDFATYTAGGAALLASANPTAYRLTAVGSAPLLLSGNEAIVLPSNSVRTLSDQILVIVINPQTNQQDEEKKGALTCK